ncbi:cytochrome P450 81E8-like [Papaver somniferum]|uniref:cytochrome P450 81E8-like n=1 Tax=Papaver somniferum TaxID=3469 RepID=UPI000E6F57C8|nr:cytochrome P450 81E8-like [Papaver somniferum]
MDIFSYSSLQKTSNIRNAEVQYMLHQLYQRSLSSSSTEIFHEVDLKPVFFEFGFIIIMKIVSGKRSYNGSKKWSFDRLISESFLPEKLINTVDHFPVLRWIGYQSTERKLKQGRKNKDSFLDELIQDYLLDTSSSADIDVVDGRKAEHKPLIGVFMSLQQDEPETYTDEVVKGIIGTMFSGGIGTSVDTMVAAMSLLLKHPEALVKLRDEIEFHVEEGRFISESDLPKLPYLQCVIQESLRLHPPVTIPLPHLLSQDCTVAGYDIPLGTWLSIFGAF